MSSPRGRQPAGTRESAADAPPAGRGARPPSIELASALLIVSGVIGTFVMAVALPAANELGAAAVGVLAIGLYVVSVVIGLLIRYGRAWILAVNYVAVLGFLDVSWAAGGGQLALIFAFVDLFVFVVVFANRPWFVGEPPSP